MSDTPDKQASAAGRETCLEISLQSVASNMQGSTGQVLPFSRAVLQLRNVCDVELASVMLHATLGQEGGTLQDVSGALAADAVIPAGGVIAWDVYDILIPAHPGAASKIHMFGYRAALNWRFELTVRAEYSTPGSPRPVTLEDLRWAFRWYATGSSSGEVALDIEEVKA